MEFNNGDVIIATGIEGSNNGFVNGDIVQITRKEAYNDYNVKIIHKEDDPKYNGNTTWGIMSEYRYFELL